MVGSYNALDSTVKPLATAFVVQSDGTYTYSGVTNSSGTTINKANYTKTDANGLHVYVNNNEVNWATSHGTGTPELSIGEKATDTQRWQFRMSGDLLNISWHS